MAPIDGNGSGASIAAGTLGGNGAAIIRQIVGQFPALQNVFTQMNGQAADDYTVYKSVSGISVALVPPSTTLSAGTFDALFLG